MSTAKERLKAIPSPNAYRQTTDVTDGSHLSTPSVSNVSNAPMGIPGKVAQVEPPMGAAISGQLNQRPANALPSPAAEIRPTAPDPDDFAERAAIIEHDGGITQPLADCLAAILTAGKPMDMPAVRWLRFQTDAALLVDQWGAKALALGWTADDLLGVDVIAPWQRIDCMGLAWLLNGATVTALDTKTATIGTGSATHSFTRKEF